ncbi:MAG: sialate O-acetylesterase [Planctomycetota bacterium]
MKSLFRLAPALVFVVLGSSGLFAANPLKVFVLAGQSNMQGHAHLRTFEHVGMDAASAPLLSKMQNSDGKPRVCDDVWVSSIGSSEQEKVGRLTVGFGAERGGPKIGPEFLFGIHMQEALGEPILIIKTAWGGKSLHTDFRSPSGGAYEFTDEQLDNIRKRGNDVAEAKSAKAEATGHYYRLMIEHVREVLGNIKRVYPDYDADAGYELAGFVWFQGWNDMVDRGVYPSRDKPGGYDLYSQLMGHFIRDVRKDLAAPKLPFVIGVLGVGGPVSKYGPDQKRYSAVHQNFRDAMAAPALLPEFQGNVAVVKTEAFWDLELSGLLARRDEINREMKKKTQESKLSRDQQQKLRTEWMSAEFSKREQTILETGTSNAAFHYLGCAKIMARIGEGFAEALLEQSPR